MISLSTDEYAVFAELEGGVVSNVGCARSRGSEIQIHCNRTPVSSLAELARVIPQLLITTDSIELLTGGSLLRRQYIDWGVFHVKPEFGDLWRSAQRCIKQRNALLQTIHAPGLNTANAERLEAWDVQFVELANHIDVLRADYVVRLLPHVEQVLKQFGQMPKITLAYQRGWQGSLHEQLYVMREKDIQKGYTSLGPHRANLDLRIGQQKAFEVLSRGQMKLAIIALKLAQGLLFIEQTGRHPVILIDDLAAELDRNHRKELCGLLDEMGCQIFITGVDIDLIDVDWQNPSVVKKFHVERGVING